MRISRLPHTTPRLLYLRQSRWLPVPNTDMPHLLRHWQHLHPLKLPRQSNWFLLRWQLVKQYLILHQQLRQQLHLLKYAKTHHQHLFTWRDCYRNKQKGFYPLTKRERQQEHPWYQQKKICQLQDRNISVKTPIRDSYHLIALCSYYHALERNRDSLKYVA